MLLPGMYAHLKAVYPYVPVSRCTLVTSFGLSPCREMNAVGAEGVTS